MRKQRFVQLARKFPRHVLKHHAEDYRKSADQTLLMYAGPFAVRESRQEEGLRVLAALQPDKNVADRQLHMPARPLNKAYRENRVADFVPVIASLWVGSPVEEKRNDHADAKSLARRHSRRRHSRN